MRSAVLVDSKNGGHFKIRELADPVVRNNEIVIKLAAASINPLDTMMRQGYGESLFHWLRRKGPVVLGLDGAGVVTAVGSKVKNFKPGDQVMAAVMPFRSGFYSEAITVPASWACKIPKTLSVEEAAALPYAGLTAYSVLYAAGLNATTAHGKRILVHGGSGGIGSILIQLLNSWGAWVATTCSTSNIEFVRSLGARQVIDYKHEKFTDVLSGLDVVVNTVTPKDLRLNEAPHLSVLRRGGHYVSLISPTLTLADALTAPLGLAVSGAWMAGASAYWMMRGKHHHWVYFKPSSSRLKQLSSWVDAGIVRPIIGKTFTLDQIQEAHKAVEAGPACGKVIVKMSSATTPRKDSR